MARGGIPWRNPGYRIQLGDVFEVTRDLRGYDLKEKPVALGSSYQPTSDQYQNHGFVFASTVGSPLDARNLSRHFERVMAGAGLGTREARPLTGTRGPKPRHRFRPAFRTYDLRHTCATLLFLAGEHAKIVPERLGHSSVTLTLDTYSHVLPDMQEESARKLEAMFGTG